MLSDSLFTVFVNQHSFLSCGANSDKEHLRTTFWTFNGDTSRKKEAEDRYATAATTHCSERRSSLVQRCISNDLIAALFLRLSRLLWVTGLDDKAHGASGTLAYLRRE